jgi:CDP-diacylglycerol--serine O-phosphatidyltransferase
MTDGHQIRWSYFVPNTFTALNLGCGFVSILKTWSGEYHEACLLLLLGSIFDSVDGRIARFMGAQSSFGEEFDSLSDLVSFGLAPALLFYHRYLSLYGRVGIAVTFLFALCGALRLARFNVSNDSLPSNFFQGLPIPMGALALTGHVLFSLEYGVTSILKWSAIPFILIMAILMVSKLPFCSFKYSNWVKTHKRHSLLIILFILVGLFLNEKIAVGSVVMLYILGCMGYYILYRNRLKGIFDGPQDED